MTPKKKQQETEGAQKAPSVLRRPWKRLVATDRLRGKGKQTR